MKILELSSQTASSWCGRGGGWGAAVIKDRPPLLHSSPGVYE